MSPRISALVQKRTDRTIGIHSPEATHQNPSGPTALRTQILRLFAQRPYYERLLGYCEPEGSSTASGNESL